MKESNTIFLAHASEDKPFVRKLYKQLKTAGMNPWLDEKDLPPGVRWEDYIPGVIKEAKFFIICISKQSIRKTGYVQKEMRIALSHFEQKPPNSIYLIPVLVDDVELPELTVGTIKLADYNAVRAYKPGALNNLVNFLQKQMNLIQKIKEDETPTFDKIREAVEVGEIDTAIRSLVQYAKSDAVEYSNNVTLISARYNQLRKNNLLGVISNENYTMESNKVIFSILELLRILEKDKSY